MKNRLVLIIAALVLILAGLFLIIGPQQIMGPLMLRMMPPPADLDLATTRLSDKGIFQIAFTPALDPIAINQMHSWTLHVATADQQPVTDATITVDGGMPQHGHGLPTQPQVTQNLGKGTYLVEGIKFQMGGWWEVKYRITSGDKSDQVTFNLVLR